MKKLYASLLSLALLTQVQADWVWWEAESSPNTNLSTQHAFSTQTPQETAVLSEGKWLGIAGPREEVKFAEYEVTVSEAGDYTFFVRKFWKHGPFRWRFNDQDWQQVDRSIGLLDNAFIRKHLGANWVNAGSVPLPVGTHSLRIELTEQDGAACFDAFLLTNEAFVPRGTLKPGEKSNLAEPGYFAWEPEPDPLSDGSAIDMRFLNETEAGVSGFVRREGDHFVTGGGDPIHFWMVQGGSLTELEKAQMDRTAKRMAKYGINIVRFQLSSLFNFYTNQQPDNFDQKLDRIHYLIYALKREGIYTKLGHLYWHTHNKLGTASVGPDWGGRDSISGIYAEPTVQQHYFDYVKEVMSRPNPYSGLAIKDDPAVAIIEIMNESSLFFHTFNPANFPEAERAVVETLWADWVAKTYGSIEKGLQAWGPEKSPRGQQDQPEAGRLALYNAGFLASADWAEAQRNAKRAADQTHFMYELQQEFYERTVDTFRNQIGIQAVISVGNWKTTDPKNLNTLERALYTSGDAIARNSYYATTYQKGKQGVFHAVELGDTYKSTSALLAPNVAAPLMTPHIADYPMMITENTWTRPNQYRAEFPFMIATYGSMMGYDAWSFFSYDSAEWQTPMAVWDLNNPSLLGQFPAFSLAFRKGYFKEAEVVATENVSLEETFRLKGTRVFPTRGADSLWVERLGDKESNASAAASEFDPRLFFVGRVVQEISETGTSSFTSEPLATYHDPDKGVIRSETNELFWNYKVGVLKADAPKAQGVVGFLNQEKRFETSDFAFASENEYGSMFAVSLDGQDLATSDRILLQLATHDKPYGFSTKEVEGYQEITHLGGYPLNVANIKGQVLIKTDRRPRVEALDANGYPTGEFVEVTASENGFTFTLPENRIYLHLTY